MPMKTKTQNHAIESIVFFTANQGKLNVAYLQTLIAAWSLSLTRVVKMPGFIAVGPGRTSLFFSLVLVDPARPQRSSPLRFFFVSVS